MRQFNKIAIIGVGLIGGSIALAIKKRKIAREVVGVFRRRSTLKRALRSKAIDKGTMFIEKGVKGADIVIIASPVRCIPKLVKETVKFAKKGAVITDVGSTKKWIVSEAERIIGPSTSVAFIGSHPMAGSEHAGVEFARAGLLEKAPCIVTKTVKTNTAALKKIISFWRCLGSDVKVMSPAAHDSSVASVSHLPHIAAFGLAGAVPEKALPCAAEGFKDTTRIASSDPKLWADIFLTNKKEILKAGRLFETYYKNILEAISEGDYSGTVKLLKKAKAKRDKLIYGKTV